jgi:hypothetical protein
MAGESLVAMALPTDVCDQESTGAPRQNAEFFCELPVAERSTSVRRILAPRGYFFRPRAGDTRRLDAL